ncbi:hypothetical protein RHSIM_Rhsim08G0142800 [Rhododendron simsii]|uniref:FAR1 domain-containing protein n=1 Tax=Rhododendron simsii TaxID=118357 RepID=A0A834GI55_RHOSS|nr:hypothetical protein RHSIM_Rhsim08G0142800 [Rhododendron simsii]
MNPQHSMPEHLRVMSAMIRDLRAVGNVLTDEQQILAMLRSLPDKTWDHFKLTMTHNEIVKTFNDLKCHLELEAERQDAMRGNEVLVVEPGQRKTIGSKCKRQDGKTLDVIQLLSPSSSQLCEESTNSCQLYTPQVKNELIPRINQQFRNLDDAYVFYNNYAFHVGFSVRINSSKTDKNGETIRKDYVCFKERERRISKATTTRRRGLTREKCGAKLAVMRARSGEGFVVSNFVEGHSHPLTTPRKAHLLKSHRRISDAQKSLTQHLAAANVPPHQQMSILELQVGGLEHVEFLPRDLYNKNRDERNCVDGYGADMLLQVF